MRDTIYRKYTYQPKKKESLMHLECSCDDNRLRLGELNINTDPGFLFTGRCENN